MFEIGNSLREARVRRGIDFAQAEVSTKIRGKYLRALEDEQFDILPAQTYVKGFLRTYAEFLGLDGQLYVDEYNSRFVIGEEHEPHARRTAARPQRRNRRLETLVVIGALALVSVLMIVVIAAWKSAGDNPRTTTARTAAPAHASRATAPLLLVTPRRGATHLTVRTSSASGAVRFDGTLQPGDAPVAIRGSHKLWVQIDSPENVVVAIRGKTVHSRETRPVVKIVSATGWRTA